MRPRRSLMHLVLWTKSIWNDTVSMRHRSFDEISLMCAMMKPRIWRIGYHWIHTSWICIQNRWHTINHDEIDQWRIQIRNDTQSKTTQDYYIYIYIYMYIYIYIYYVYIYINIYIYNEDSTLWNISLEYYARYRIDILVQARLRNDDDRPILSFSISI